MNNEVRQKFIIFHKIRALFEGEINTGAGKTSQKLRPQKDLAEDPS